MEPFFPKSKLNAKLSVRVLGRTVRYNGFPGGHTDLHCRHPGIEEDFVKGILIIKVFSTYFQPEIVKDEASQDVEGLTGVGEAARVVRKEAGRVVFKFQGDFTKENKRPGQREVVMGFPFDPDTFIGFPGGLSPGAVEKAMLRGLFDARATHFALWGEAHEVEPGAYRKALIEGEPDEGAHFSWAGAMPYSGDGLWS
ncbi:unnamed protein product [Sphagnum balticum]